MERGIWGGGGTEAGNELIISILFLKQTRNISRNNCNSITRMKPDFAKMSRCQESYDKLRFLSWRVPIGRNNNARCRWNDSENEPSPVPKPALLPAMHVGPLLLSRMTMQTHVILSPDASGPLLRSRARMCVQIKQKKKEKFLTYTGLVLHRSEVYLAVDWHENPVEAFIMDGAVGLEKGKKYQSIRQLNTTRAKQQLLARHSINWFISQCRYSLPC